MPALTMSPRWEPTKTTPITKATTRTSKRMRIIFFIIVKGKMPLELWRGKNFPNTSSGDQQPHAFGQIVNLIGLGEKLIGFHGCIGKNVFVHRAAQEDHF